jgi:hypothetical protein
MGIAHVIDRSLIAAAGYRHVFAITGSPIA